MTRSPTEEVTVATGEGVTTRVGPLRSDEESALFVLFAEIVARRDGFPHSPPLTRADFEATWVRPVSAVVAARDDGGLVGAYYLKPNFIGRGAHLANAGYVVAPARRRLGIGRALVEDSLWRAPLLGFDAMVFNLVFASNPARRLYEALGFRALGRIPAAVDGEDALIYWRSVGGPGEETSPGEGTARRDATAPNAAHRDR